MAQKKFTVLDLLELDLSGHDALELRCIGGRRGLVREISIPDINRPGLAISGFFDSFVYKRVQLFGKGETAYIQKLHDEKNDASLKQFFSYKIPCCVFSNNREPTKMFFRLAEEACCPILQTSLETTDFSSRLIRIFSNIFAPKKTIHAVLVEVYGVGILLLGESGIGKSETALELVERGHRLVADDSVEIRCVNGNTLLGRGANPLISHHMEIRGVGIINVSRLYGTGVVLEQKEIQLVVKLEEWDSKKSYERLGLDPKFTDILGVKIPILTIPVRHGRNLPIIIEAASMNERLKNMGESSAKEFSQNVLKWIENGEASSIYYGNDEIY